MERPPVVFTGTPAWADVVMQRIHAHYRPVVYTEREGYVARLADDHAALVLVDGEADEWRFWVTTAKISPATRRIPVVLVSNDAQTRENALVAGANAAFTPTDLLESLADLLDGMARVVDEDAARRMDEQCAEPLPAEGVEAIRKFNAGEFYKQHDLFEALWVAEEGPVRDLYRAILQVGVAYYQITRGNHRGALKLLLRSVQWLALLPDECQGVDVAQLKRDAAAVRAELERVGENGLADFDKSLLKGVRMVGEEEI